MKLDSLEAVYIAQLKDLCSVEKQLDSALDKMESGASNARLKEAFAHHRKETKEHLARLEKLLTAAGLSVGRKKCSGMAGIIAEGDEVLEAKGDEAAKDAALIAAAQRVEHYEIAVYGTVVTLAGMLGKTEDQRTLRTTLDEEKSADRLLTQIAMGSVNPEAEGAPDLDEEKAAGGGGSGRGLGKGGVGPTGSAAGAAGVSSKVRSSGMHDRRDDYDDDGSRGRGAYEGGRRSSPMQDRDEYGQFTGGGNRESRGSSGDDRRSYGSSRGSSYDEDDRYSSRGSSAYYGQGSSRGSYDDRGRGSSEGGWEGARRSSQERNEYGQFTSGGNRESRGSSEDDRGYASSRGSSQPYGQGSRGYEQDDRGYSSRGSSGTYGQSGSYGQGGSRGWSDDDRGRGSSEGGWESSRRSSPERNEYGQFTGGGSRGSRGNSDDDDRGYSSRGPSQSYGSSGQGGSRGGRGDSTDSAGRHYTRESWERAQEGRMLGGQHSHGGR